MRTLPAAIEARLNDDPYLACQLVLVEGPTTYRWTDWSQDVLYDGQTWLHGASFELSQLVTDADGGQAAQIAFDEQDQQLSAIDLTEGTRARVVRIYEAWFDASDTKNAVGAVLLAVGRTDGIEFDEEGQNSLATLSVDQWFVPIDTNGPRNKYALSCVNTYKDGRCKYAGALPTCAHTYADCQVHDNTINFRGCRHALTPPATVLWGGNAKTITVRR